MKPVHSPSRQREHRASPPLRVDDERQDISSIIEENAQLRELVIQLSKLVIKNVVDRK